MYGFHPDQQCNVTALAMVGSYHTVGPSSVDGSGYEEALLTTIVERLGGSPYVPKDMAAGFNKQYPTLYDQFYASATIPQICSAIDAGNPCVIHGYFTRSGHIVTVVGYDSTHLYIHDPYGEWSASGYERNTPKNPTIGKLNKFKKTTITELCDYGGIWCHFISKRT